MMTGRARARLGDAMDTLVLAVTKPALQIRTVSTDIPAVVAEVIDKALAYRKEDRWENAKAMRSALRSAIRVLGFEGGSLRPSHKPQTFDEGPISPATENSTVRSALPLPARSSSYSGARKSSPSDPRGPRQRYSSGVTVTSYGKCHSRAGWMGALLGLALIGVLVGRHRVPRALRRLVGRRRRDARPVPPVSAAAPRAPDLTPPDPGLEQIDKSALATPAPSGAASSGRSSSVRPVRSSAPMPPAPPPKASAPVFSPPARRSHRPPILSIVASKTTRRMRTVSRLAAVAALTLSPGLLRPAARRHDRRSALPRWTGRRRQGRFSTGVPQVRGEQPPRPCARHRLQPRRLRRAHRQDCVGVAALQGGGAAPPAG